MFKNIQIPWLCITNHWGPLDPTLRTTDRYDLSLTISSPFMPPPPPHTHFLSLFVTHSLNGRRDTPGWVLSLFCHLIFTFKFKWVCECVCVLPCNGLASPSRVYSCFMPSIPGICSKSPATLTRIERLLKTNEWMMNEPPLVLSSLVVHSMYFFFKWWGLQYTWWETIITLGLQSIHVLYVDNTVRPYGRNDHITQLPEETNHFACSGWWVSSKRV